MKAVIQNWEKDNWYKGMLNEQFFVEPAGTSHFFVLGKGIHAGKTIKSRHCDIITRGIDLSEMVGKIEILEEEKALLLQQIEREVEGQKPITLPLHVAEAVEYFKTSGYSDQYILGIMYGVNYKEGHIHCQSLLDYRCCGGGINIANAIVNGYAVETVEGKIKAAILNFVEERSEKNVGYIIANDSEEFSQRITELVNKIIREDQTSQ